MSTTTTKGAKGDHKAHAGAPAAAAPESTAARTVPAEFTGGVIAHLPVRFHAGQVLDDNTAEILQTAVVRQYINNVNANIKNRAERYAKATNDAGRAANAPLTPEEIAADFSNYLPNVGGGARGSTMERLKAEAAWQAWVDVVAEHNAAVVKPHGEPVIIKAGKRIVHTTPQRGDFSNEADHKAALKAWREAGKAAFVTQLQTVPWMAERIQAALDALLRKREADKTAPASTTPSVNGMDLLV
jgi:hypothetical protein